jgi:hypothetical protein
MDRNLAGMTINERLGELRLFEEWDKAAGERNRAKMIEVMLKVDLTEDEAIATVNTVLANPRMYGF